MIDPMQNTACHRFRAALAKSAFKNNGSGNEIGFWIFDYPAQNELQVREHLKYLLRNLERTTSSRTSTSFRSSSTCSLNVGYLTASVSRK